MLHLFVRVQLYILQHEVSYFSVHTRDKQDVAARLVAGALSVIYHHTAIYDGPFPESITGTHDHKIVIKYPKYHQLAVTDQGNFQVCASQTILLGRCCLAYRTQNCILSCIVQ